MPQRQLTLSDRIKIESGLYAKRYLKQIAASMNRSISTISREIQNNRTEIAGDRPRGKDCAIAGNCAEKHLCGDIECSRKCVFCKDHDCVKLCNHPMPLNCKKLTKPPYVCNCFYAFCIWTLAAWIFSVTLTLIVGDSISKKKCVKCLM